MNSSRRNRSSKRSCGSKAKALFVGAKKVKSPGSSKICKILTRRNRNFRLPASVGGGVGGGAGMATGPQLTTGLPELEVVAEDPTPPGANDEDPPVTITEFTPFEHYAGSSGRD